MKIAVNTRLLLHGKLEGIGWFSYENLKRITTGHPEHQFYFLFDRPYHRDFIFSDNVIPLVAGPPARHPVLYYIWFEFTVRRLLKKIGADLFLSPDGYLSLGSKIPSIAVFHDLNFEHYPGDLPLAERWYYRTFFRKYAAKAARIATVSGFSKADITKQYGKYTGGRPYFFFVGSMHPRKNLVNLFRAFDLYRKTDNRNTVLLLAGAKKWWTGEIASVYENMEFKDDVIFSGRLETSEMRDVMGSAIALTYVSYFEGFGIPIVEAFRCGTPVITSNITSMPEVGGEAALYADPFKPGEIADAMIKIANDDTLREHLIKAGAERAGIFTWDQSALRLWQTIEKVLATQTDFSARL